MEQTRKYNSSGWRSSKWMLLLLFTGIAMAQDIDSSIRNQSLASRFPAAMLEAHQVNSVARIGDFYHYLNLLSATDDKQLQTQLKENIYALFDDKNTLIDNFLTEKNDPIPLSYLLDNIASRNFIFSFKPETPKPLYFRDYWFDTYTLEWTQDGQSSARKIKQRVYLKPEDKTFGATSKAVLSVTLGGIE